MQCDIDQNERPCRDNRSEDSDDLVNFESLEKRLTDDDQDDCGKTSDDEPGTGKDFKRHLSKILSQYAIKDHPPICDQRRIDHTVVENPATWKDGESLASRCAKLAKGCQ